MNVELLDKRIAELKLQLEQLVAQANQAIGEMRGRIAEAEAIRGMLDKPEPDPPTG